MKVLEICYPQFRFYSQVIAYVYLSFVSVEVKLHLVVSFKGNCVGQERNQQEKVPQIENLEFKRKKLSWSTISKVAEYRLLMTRRTSICTYELFHYYKFDHRLIVTVRVYYVLCFLFVSRETSRLRATVYQITLQITDNFTRFDVTVEVKSKCPHFIFRPRDTPTSNALPKCLVVHEMSPTSIRDHEMSSISDIHKTPCP